MPLKHRSLESTAAFGRPVVPEVKTKKQGSFWRTVACASGTPSGRASSRSSKGRAQEGRGAPPRSGTTKRAPGSMGRSLSISTMAGRHSSPTRSALASMVVRLWRSTEPRWFVFKSPATAPSLQIPKSVVRKAMRFSSIMATASPLPKPRWPLKYWATRLARVSNSRQLMVSPSQVRAGASPRRSAWRVSRVPRFSALSRSYCFMVAPR